MILDETAVEKLKDIILEENNPATKLRVFVQGGGCSGFQYGFTLDDSQNDDDFEFNFEGVAVVVDAMSMNYLQGATIKYHEDIVGSSFVIENPNAQSTCGCGSSFNPY